MRKFDTKVQEIKYKVLKEVAHQAYNGELYKNLYEIPKIIIPGKVPQMRCCVYKERAILEERVKIVMGGSSKNKNVIELIDIACDDCPAGGYLVTDGCRGCLAHRCEEACRVNAIWFDEKQRAHIDKSKCVECGMCSKACPYSSIINQKRPCEQACKVGAITFSEEKTVIINDDKCISCGACVYQCPFGAIQDKSYILNIIDLIEKSESNTKYKVYALIAPSIYSQFKYAKLGQVIKAIKLLGFYSVIETALGADMVAYKECNELKEKGTLTSSCCPAFVSYIYKQFPELKDKISSTLSPMATLGRYIKKKDPTAKVVFIGPCIAKKQEIKNENIKQYVDSVMTFEELAALIDSKEIILSSLEEEAIDDASYYGRIFARSGGLSEAIREGLKERNISDFIYKPVACNGIEECKIALTRLQHDSLDANFIEGMACVGGCVGGAGILTHGDKNIKDIDKYKKEAIEKNILDSIFN